MFHLYFANFLFHLVDCIVNFSVQLLSLFDISVVSFSYSSSRLAIWFSNSIAISSYVGKILFKSSLCFPMRFFYAVSSSSSFKYSCPLCCYDIAQSEQTKMSLSWHWYLLVLFWCVSHFAKIKVDFLCWKGTIVCFPSSAEICSPIQDLQRLTWHESRIHSSVDSEKFTC